MNDLTFKISTPAELSGAQKALAVLEEQIAKAKLLGKDLEKIEALEKRAAAARASIASFKPPPDNQNPQAKATQQQALFNKEAKESQALLQALSSSGIPGVGLAATAAFSVSTAGAAALGLAVAEIVASVQAAKKEMEEFMALAPAFQRHADATRGMKAALSEARIEAAAFSDELERMQKIQSDVRTEHERTARALQSQAEAANAAKSAEQDLLDKALEEAVARGQLTKEVANQIKATLELRQVEAAAAKARQAELDEIAQKEVELAEARAKVKEATEALPGLRDAQAADLAAIKRLEQDLSNAYTVRNGPSQAEFNKGDKVYQEFAAKNPDISGLSSAELAKERAALEASLAGSDGEGQAVSVDRLSRISQWQEIAAQRDRLLKSLQDAQALVNAAPGQIEALKIQAASRGKDIAEAEASAKKATGDIDAITDDLSTRRPTFGVNEEARRRELEARRRIYSLEFTPPPSPSTGPRTSADAWSKDRGGSAAVPDVSGFAETNQELLGLIRTLIDQSNETGRIVRGLRQQVNNNRPGSN